MKRILIIAALALVALVRLGEIATRNFGKQAIEEEDAPVKRMDLINSGGWGKRMDLINSGEWNKRAFDLVGSVSSLMLSYNIRSSKGRMGQAHGSDQQWWMEQTSV